MILNERYFQPPSDATEKTFSELFHSVINAGVGLTADPDGLPIGTWTADLLAEKISNFEDNRKGVDPRSVQRWFSNGTNVGISRENANWLARVLGCEDPEATHQWRQAILHALDYQKSLKRTKSQTTHVDVQPTFIVSGDEQGPAELNPKVGGRTTKAMFVHLRLTTLSEGFFSGLHPSILPASVWCVYTMLVFVANVLGIDSITYLTDTGVEKQVGFLWAISWALFPTLFVPLLSIFTGSLIKEWKTKLRPKLVREFAHVEHKDWYDHLSSFSGLIAIVWFVSYALIFALQWSGTHLKPLLNGATDTDVIEWKIIALVHPDVISVPNNILFSFMGYFFFSTLMLFLFIVLVLLLAVTSDYYEICRNRDGEVDPVSHDVSSAGLFILRTSFRCCIVGLLLATSIKLQNTYLLTDAPSMSAWLVGDTVNLFGGSVPKTTWIYQTALPQFTSTILCVLCAVIFTVVLSMLILVFRSSSARIFPLQLPPKKSFSGWLIGFWPCAWTTKVIILLVVNFFMVGSTPGFSILLALASLVAAYCLYDPFWGRGANDSWKDAQYE